MSAGINQGIGGVEQGQQPHSTWTQGMPPPALDAPPDAFQFMNEMLLELWFMMWMEILLSF